MAMAGEDSSPAECRWQAQMSAVEEEEEGLGVEKEGVYIEKRRRELKQFFFLKDLNLAGREVVKN